jgi:hypothetical protein
MNGLGSSVACVTDIYIRSYMPSTKHGGSYILFLKEFKKVVRRRALTSHTLKQIVQRTGKSQSEENMRPMAITESNARNAKQNRTERNRSCQGYGGRKKIFSISAIYMRRLEEKMSRSKLSKAQQRQLHRHARANDEYKLARSRQFKSRTKPYLHREGEEMVMAGF